MPLIVKDTLKSSPTQYLSAFTNKERALGAAGIAYNVWRCRANICHWNKSSVLPASNKLWHYLKVVWRMSVCKPVFTCACRLLSAPAAGSSSWPCTRPLSASVPQQCRCVWAGVCTCSQGSAPGAACSAWPAPHSKAASPGWTCLSTWNLKTKTEGKWMKEFIEICLSVYTLCIHTCRHILTILYVHVCV